MQEIGRSRRPPFTVEFGTSLSSSGVMGLGQVSAFSFLVPVGTSATTVTFYGATESNEDYSLIYLSDGSIAEVVVGAPGLYVAPAELFSIPLLKAKSTVPFTAKIVGKG